MATNGKINQIERVKVYRKQSNRDAPFKDLTHYPGRSIQELADLCASDSNCRGFNRSGWLKYDTSNLAESQEDLYLKDDGRDPGFVLEGDDLYLRYPGMDHSGDDLNPQDPFEGGKIEQMARSCSELGDMCQGFNRGGWLKEKVDPRVSDQNQDLYVKMNQQQLNQHNLTVSRQQEYYWRNRNRDAIFQDVGSQVDTSQGFSQAMQECSQNPDCIGFNSDGWLKNSNRDLSYSEGDLYIRKNHNVVPDYTQYSISEAYGYPPKQTEGMILERLPNEPPHVWPPAGVLDRSVETFSWFFMPLILDAFDLYNLGDRWVKFPHLLRVSWNDHLGNGIWSTWVQQLRMAVQNKPGPLGQPQDLSQMQEAIKNKGDQWWDSRNHLRPEIQNQLLESYLGQKLAFQIQGVGTVLRTQLRKHYSQHGGGRRRRISGYQRFISDFSRDYKGKKLFKDAARKWKSMSKKQKSKY